MNTDFNSDEEFVEPDRSIQPLSTVEKELLSKDGLEIEEDVINSETSSSDISEMMNKKKTFRMEKIEQKKTLQKEQVEEIRRHRLKESQQNDTASLIQLQILSLLKNEQAANNEQGKEKIIHESSRNIKIISKSDEKYLFPVSLTTTIQNILDIINTEENSKYTKIYNSEDFIVFTASQLNEKDQYFLK